MRKTAPAAQKSMSTINIASPPNLSWWQVTFQPQNTRATGFGAVMAITHGVPFTWYSRNLAGTPGRALAVALHCVYTLCIYILGGKLMGTARVFRSGNSQAVRLPKQFRFKSKEVEIFRRGNEVVLREKDKNLVRRSEEHTSELQSLRH